MDCAENSLSLDQKRHRMNQNLYLLMMSVLVVTGVFAYAGYRLSKQKAQQDYEQGESNIWTKHAPKIWLIWIFVCLVHFLLLLSLYLNS